ncbi:hypothetical protein [Pseudomonas sp. TE50-2]|uniref:hypothetical protein n=1 Tax=Pseudomonas sp. TE50-2 TaxID=3142707 RepID=UPI0034658DC9
MPRTKNPAHLTKNFSTQVLSAFVIDLGKCIDTGLTDEQCSANKDWLRDLSGYYAAIGDDIFGRKIFERCDDIAKEYHEWNSPNGTPKIRAAQHTRIKNKVNKLAGSYRRRIGIIEQSADMKLYLAIYSATERLILAFPGLLKSVAETSLRFPK